MMRKTLRIVLLIGLFVSMAGIGAYVALTLIIKGEEPVVVPDLVGKDVLYGLETLSDLRLNTRVRGTVYHGSVPKNHVIDQEPEPGASIKRGRDVKIRVSRGPERIAMPNLRGLSLFSSAGGQIETPDGKADTLGIACCVYFLTEQEVCDFIPLGQGPVLAHELGAPGI